jgi:beta-glucosidase
VPVVLIVIGARPLEIGPALAHSRAAIAAFYLGQEGGTALGELVFGDTSPSGRLPLTWPRSAGQLPAYYYKKPSAIGGYLFADSAPLFPFGWGLSYTSFAHSEPRLGRASIRPGERAEVELTVTNTGQRAGTEVVQLYVGARASSVTRPVRLMRGFERVALAPGQSRDVRFSVGPDDLAYFGTEMRREVEPGTYVLEVGASSAALAAVELEVREP